MFFEVCDFTSGGWGTEYRLIHKENNVVTEGAEWFSAQMTAGRTEFTNEEHGGVGTLNLSADVSVAYDQYRVSTSKDGRREAHYTLPEEYATVRTKLGNLFDSQPWRDIDDHIPHPDVDVLFLITDFRGLDVTHPYKGDVEQVVEIKQSNPDNLWEIYKRATWNNPTPPVTITTP